MSSKLRRSSGVGPHSIGSISFSMQHLLNLQDQKRLCHEGISREEMSHWQLWDYTLTLLSDAEFNPISSTSVCQVHFQPVTSRNWLFALISDAWVSVRVFVHGLKCGGIHQMSASLLGEQIRHMTSSIRISLMQFSLIQGLSSSKLDIMFTIDHGWLCEQIHHYVRPRHN